MTPDFEVNLRSSAIGKHYVYRIYDGAGSLLYVGCTSNLWLRVVTHRAERCWWPKATTLTADEFITRQDARDEEARLIRRLQPKYDRSTSPRPPREVVPVVAGDPVVF